jgi:putative FmdB family regulatory protein
MPIYEYRCQACGFQKEFLQRISDAPLKDCPECGKPSLAKMVTAAGFQLKGAAGMRLIKTRAAKPTGRRKRRNQVRTAAWAPAPVRPELIDRIAAASGGAARRAVPARATHAKSIS